VSKNLTLWVTFPDVYARFSYHATKTKKAYMAETNREFLMSSFVMLATAEVLVQSETGSWFKARALIDQGSTGCFMTKSFAHKLSLKQI